MIRHRLAARPAWLPMLLALMLCVAPITTAQVPLFPAEIQRVDVIAIERDGRNLFAFDALTGRRARVRLDVDETVVFQEARGRVGLVLTNRRALGVAPGSNFLELSFQLGETMPDRVLVDDQVALFVTNRRALGFLGSGNWAEADLSASERVIAVRVGAATGVVMTHRRALGLASGLHRFIDFDLQIKEDIESVMAQDTLVTVRTNRRILVFSAPRAVWTDQRRQLR